MHELEKHPVSYVNVAEQQQGQRLDNFLKNKLKKVPGALIYRIIRSGEVRVNKGRVKPNYRLQPGDVVRIPPLQLASVRAPGVPPKHLLELLENSILFEDANFLIINKPSGVSVHAGSGQLFGVIEVLRHLYPHFESLELAHRLDQQTSGCLVLTKNRETLILLHELLKSGQVNKIYLALVKGHPPKQFDCDFPLLKNVKESGERQVKVDKEGKASLTQFEVIESLAGATLLQAKPVTGRTHQIRVHTASSGYPIAGDSKYGDRTFNKRIRKDGLKRLFLHACSISFTLPSGQKVAVQAELDKQLSAIVEQLKY